MILNAAASVESALFADFAVVVAPGSHPADGLSKLETTATGMETQR